MNQGHTKEAGAIAECPLDTLLRGDGPVRVGPATGPGRRALPIPDDGMGDRGNFFPAETAALAASDWAARELIGRGYLLEREMVAERQARLASGTPEMFAYPERFGTARLSAEAQAAHAATPRPRCRHLCPALDGTGDVQSLKDLFG